MFSFQNPGSVQELSELLSSSARAKRTIQIAGLNSKRLLGGRVAPASVQISTQALHRVLQYEPKDLTVGVEAGMPFASLRKTLAANGQMIPLDGAWADEGTVGGLISANISGSRRRYYGTARDLVIGMHFATLDGKIVESGGMVVKNVAGLDMGKLLIGSFGTLAAITRVNFKLVPIPAVSRTALVQFDDLQSATSAALAAVRSVATPLAVDVLNPLFGAPLNLRGYNVAIQFGGNQAVIERCQKFAETLGKARALSTEEEGKFWNSVQSATPHHMDKFSDGAVVRLSTSVTDVAKALETAEGPALAHAGNGIVRQWFTRPDSASKWLAGALKREWKGVIECAGDTAKANLDLWPGVGGDFAIMKQVKQMFDPENLLNPGRLYGRL